MPDAALAVGGVEEAATAYESSLLQGLSEGTADGTIQLPETNGVGMALRYTFRAVLTKTMSDAAIPEEEKFQELEVVTIPHAQQHGHPLVCNEKMSVMLTELKEACALSHENGSTAFRRLYQGELHGVAACHLRALSAARVAYGTAHAAASSKKAAPKSQPKADQPRPEPPPSAFAADATLTQVRERLSLVVLQPDVVGMGYVLLTSVSTRYRATLGKRSKPPYFTAEMNLQTQLAAALIDLEAEFVRLARTDPRVPVDAPVDQLPALLTHTACCLLVLRAKEEVVRRLASGVVLKYATAAALPRIWEGAVEAFCVTGSLGKVRQSPSQIFDYVKQVQPACREGDDTAQCFATDLVTVQDVSTLLDLAVSPALRVVGSTATAPKMPTASTTDKDTVLMRDLPSAATLEAGLNYFADHLFSENTTDRKEPATLAASLDKAADELARREQEAGERKAAKAAASASASEGGEGGGGGAPAPAAHATCVHAEGCRCACAQRAGGGGGNGGASGGTANGINTYASRKLADERAHAAAAAKRAMAGASGRRKSALDDARVTPAVSRYPAAFGKAFDALREKVKAAGLAPLQLVPRGSVKAVFEIGHGGGEPAAAQPKDAAKKKAAAPPPLLSVSDGLQRALEAHDEKEKAAGLLRAASVRADMVVQRASADLETASRAEAAAVGKPAAEQARAAAATALRERTAAKQAARQAALASQQATEEAETAASMAFVEQAEQEEAAEEEAAAQAAIEEAAAAERAAAEEGAAKKAAAEEAEAEAAEQASAGQASAEAAAADEAAAAKEAHAQAVADALLAKVDEERKEAEAAATSAPADFEGGSESDSGGETPAETSSDESLSEKDRTETRKLRLLQLCKDRQIKVNSKTTPKQMRQKLGEFQQARAARKAAEASAKAAKAEKRAAKRARRESAAEREAAAAAKAEAAAPAAEAAAATEAGEAATAAGAEATVAAAAAAEAEAVETSVAAAAPAGDQAPPKSKNKVVLLSDSDEEDDAADACVDRHAQELEAAETVHAKKCQALEASIAELEKEGDAATAGVLRDSLARSEVLIKRQRDALAKEIEDVVSKKQRLQLEALTCIVCDGKGSSSAGPSAGGGTIACDRCSSAVHLACASVVAGVGPNAAPAHLCTGCFVDAGAY